MARIFTPAELVMTHMRLAWDCGHVTNAHRAYHLGCAWDIIITNSGLFS